MDQGLFTSKAAPGSSKKVMIASIAIIGVIAIIGTVSLLHNNHFSGYSLQQYQLEEEEFKTYVERFNKDYSDDEFQVRFMIFRDNLAFIRLHNSLNKDWTLGVNQFADLTAAEFKNIYLRRTYVPKYDETKVKDFSIDGIPASVDWRPQGAVTAIKDQGQCGSCWSFAATGGIEGIWKISGNALVSVSEQQLVSCSQKYGNDGCDGGLEDYGWEYVIANGGIASEAAYPYTSGAGKTTACIPTLTKNVVSKISSYHYVTANSPDALMAAVATQPIAVGVEADQYVWTYYKGGVITSQCGTKLDHSVLVVGYNTTASVPYYIVKNSWGTSWGINGYLYIGISSKQGVCGIQMTPSYPSI